ncbi:MAG: transcriptional antiterminator [Halieaceae bacterium]|jgi:transcriptional antiterminator
MGATTQTTLQQLATECHVSLRKLQLDVKSGILEITRVGRTPFVTEEQKEIYFLRNRVANSPRTYAEERELERLGFRAKPNE